MRINTNVSALNSQRILGNTGSAVAKNLQKLSSGFRINKAADDAAGLGIANKLRADGRSLKQASRNAEQATSMLQVAEGAVGTVQSIVERMKELATQAASDNTDKGGRDRIQAEFSQLRNEITRIADTTKFQGKALINGGLGVYFDRAAASNDNALAGGVQDVQLNGAKSGAYTLTAAAGAATAGKLTMDFGGVTQTVDAATTGEKQLVSFDKFGITLELSSDYVAATVGAAGSLDADTINLAAPADADGDGATEAAQFMVSSSGQYTSGDLISIGNLDVSVSALGIGADDLSTATGAQTALANLDTAISTISTVFGSIGAAQNRIEYATTNVKTSIENIAAAESTIRDADMAAEMTEFSNNQILQQAGISMLAQANSSSQAILKLLG